MSESPTADDQAIMLLAIRLKGTAKGDPSPLTPIEYDGLASWLHAHDRRPGDLLGDFDAALADWEPPTEKMTVERLRFLLGRGMSLAIEQERWTSAGLWIVTRASRSYPGRLRQRMGRTRPPLLFGAGDVRLLDQGGIGIVGSRDASGDEIDVTRTVAAAAAGAGRPVVSGGARGVDTEAKQACLEAGGRTVAILADSLLRQATTRDHRQALRDGALCLASPYHPEARFQSWAAMARNAVVYSLCEAVLIACSARGSGGTWNGAIEGRKMGVPLLVNDASRSDGARALLAEGVAPLELPGDRSTCTATWFEGLLERAAAAANRGPEPPSGTAEQLGFDFNG